MDGLIAYILSKKYTDEHGGGGGLPDPTELDDGTILVKVGNEWKTQSGYGYEGEPITIEWDGNTEGREEFFPGAGFHNYLISENCPSEMPKTITVTTIYNGTEFTEETNPFMLEEAMPIWVVSNIMGYTVIGVMEDFSIEETSLRKGIYFWKHESDITTKVVLPASVTKIDEKFIPSGSDEFVINFTMTMGGGVIADKTIEEAVSALEEGKEIVAKLAPYGDKMPGGIYTGFYFLMFQPDMNTMYTILIQIDDGEGWIATEKTYTLLPSSAGSPATESYVDEAIQEAIGDIDTAFTSLL